jgi:hypothetical protein
LLASQCQCYDSLPAEINQAAHGRPGDFLRQAAQAQGRWGKFLLRALPWQLGSTTLFALVLHG